MASEDDDLRRRADALVREREEQGKESRPPRKAHDYTGLATRGGAGAALIVAVVQLLQDRVSPEEVRRLRERLEEVEDERTKRRLWEYERDRIHFCRDQQQDERLQSILPSADSMVKPPPKPWFDKCPTLPEPTTGTGVKK